HRLWWAVSLHYSAALRGGPGFSLCLSLLLLLVCFPAVRTLLPASASHVVQGFALATGCLSRSARAEGGRALGLCHVAAGSSCHRLAVAHRRKLCGSACAAVAVSDAVGVHIGVGARCMRETLA